MLEMRVLQVLDAERKEDGLTPLFVAVDSNSTERVQLFIEAGAKMTHTLPDGVNIMHRAVQLYSLNVHEVRLEGGSRLLPAGGTWIESASRPREATRSHAPQRRDVLEPVSAFSGSRTKRWCAY